MELIREFKDLGKSDANIAGGKGASLGEMTGAGISVPPGFVILASTFEKFLEETDLDVEVDAVLDSVNHNEVHTVEHASEKIQSLILAAEMPRNIEVDIEDHFKKLGAQFVAVRSSATAEDSASAAWAGQLDSFLNTTKETLLVNVKKCWASLFTPRAIFYRFEKELHKTKISVAVVVQKMVESDVSGVAFSVHPVTEDRNQLIIEGGFGLGEAIVSGSITPDSYVVEKEPRRIIDKNIAEQTKAIYRVQSEVGPRLGGPTSGEHPNEWRDVPIEKRNEQKLSDDQILLLGDLIIKIENHYGFPCDIEWALEGGTFYITQSRPITTLAVNEELPTIKEQRPAQKDLVETNFGNWRLVITRNMSFWHQWLSSLGHFHNTKDYGVNIEQRQLSIVTGSTQSSIFVEPHGIQEYSQAVMNLVSSREGIKKLKGCYRQFAEDLLLSLEKLNKDINLKNWDNFVKDYTRFCAGLFLTSTVGRAGMIKLMELLQKKSFSEVEASEAIGLITYPDEHTPLFESQLDLLKIAEKIQMGDLSNEDKKILSLKWLEKHGFIPVNFCEDPWTLQDVESQLSEFLSKNCAQELAKFTQEHETKALNKGKKLKEIDDDEVSILAEALAEGTYLNEFRKNIFSRVSLGYRSIFSQIAKMGESDNWRDCFYLIPDEMRSLLEGVKFKISDIVSERSAVGFYGDVTGINRILEKDDLDKFIQFINIKYGNSASSNIDGQEVKGFIANRGKVTGAARIVLSARDFHKVKRGDVLVTTMTSVDFVPIMEKASAFVTNEGGVTSHASIVAREMNKPCIIGTQIATQVLKDGDLVEVDADSGVVKIIKRNEEQSESYELHFRQSGFLFIFTDINFHPKNGAFDYVILQKGGDMAAYLTSKGKKQAYESGKVWLNEEKSQDLIKDLESLLNDLKSGVAMGPLEKLEKDDYIGRWEIIESVSDRFARLYRYCEHPVVAALEDVILKACPSEDDLLLVLKNPKYAEDLKFTPEVKKYLNLLIKIGELKFDLHKAVEPLWVECGSLLEELAAKFNCSFEEMSALRADEMTKLLGGENLLPKDLLDERLNGLVFMPQGGESGLLLTGSSYMEWKNKVENIKDGEIRGIPAFKGKVRGRVKIHASFLEGDIVPPGTVVVAGMTNPQLVPFLKDAVAIVTDEGGLTCHAAIIARELKKPCIIGTKIATQVLKDGDWVEVDADSGIVKIIK